MSTTGTAKTHRQSRPASQRPTDSMIPAGRRPMTWSQCSIAASNGSMWPAVQGSCPVVISTSGHSDSMIADASRSPLSSVMNRNGPVRPLSRRRSRIEEPTARARSLPSVSITTTNTSAPGKGSRRKCASKGSRYSSSIAREPPTTKGSSPTRSTVQRSSATPGCLPASNLSSWRSSSAAVLMFRFTTLPLESTRIMVGKAMIP